MAEPPAEQVSSNAGPMPFRQLGEQRSTCRSPTSRLSTLPDESRAALWRVTHG